MNEMKFIRPIITSTYYNLVYTIVQDNPLRHLNAATTRATLNNNCSIIIVIIHLQSNLANNT